MIFILVSSQSPKRHRNITKLETLPFCVPLEWFKGQYCEAKVCPVLITGVPSAS